MKPLIDYEWYIYIYNTYFFCTPAFKHTRCVYIYIYMYISLYIYIYLHAVKWKLRPLHPLHQLLNSSCEELNSQRPELVGLDPLAAVVAPGLAAHLVV